MADEDLKVTASLRDELSAPIRKVREEVRRTAREVDQVDRSAGKADRSLGGMTRSFAAASSGGTGFFGVLRKVAGGLGSGLVTAAKIGGAAIVGAFAGVAVGVAKVVGLASDAAESSSKFLTVFDGIPEVAANVADLNARFGITTQELQDASSTFGVFGKAAGVPSKALGAFTNDLVGAGLDLSSFYNVDPGQVFEDLRSGLAGEAEPLRKYGVFLSDAVMKSRAAEMGLTGDLTEQQKVMVRQSVIMDSLGDAQGDMDRTSDSLANKTRALKGRFKQLATVVGSALVPMVSKLFAWLDDKLAPIVATLTEQGPNLGAAFEDVFNAGDWQGVAEVIDNIGGNTGKWIGPVLAFGAGVQWVLDVFRFLVAAYRTAGFDGLVDGLDGVTGAGGRLSDAWAIVKQMGEDVLTIWRDAVAPGLQEASDMLGPVISTILSPLLNIDEVLGFLADHASALAPVVTVLALAWSAYSVAAGIATAVQWAMNAATEANPYVLAATAIAAVAAGVWMLWRHSKKARPWIVAVGIALGLAFFPLVMLLGAVVAGIVWAYKNVDWFRSAVQAVGRFGVIAFNAIVTAVKAVASWLVDVWNKSEPLRQKLGELAAVSFAAITAFLGEVATKVQEVWNKTAPLREAMGALAAVSFEILKLALAWIWQQAVDLWDKLEPVRSVLETIGSFGLDVLRVVIQWVIDKVSDLWDALDPVRTILSEIGGFALDTLTGGIEFIVDKLQWVVDNASSIGDALSKGLGVVTGGLLGGDTATPRAGGGPGNLGRTLAAGAYADGITPGRRQITNVLRGSSPGSDHVAGKAFDVVGSNLGSYARTIKGMGGFAEMHGAGGNRHLHVAIGDTATPRASAYASRASSSGGGSGTPPVILGPGSIVVYEPASDVDLENAIAAGIRQYVRDDAERRG